jgi:RNA polymerase sigma-70 factor (ECF subfamily)
MRDSTIETVYRNSHERLLRFVRARVSDPEVAADIVQSVFVKLYRRLEQGASIRKPEAFVYTVARRAIIDYYRTRRQYQELPEPEEPRPFEEEDDEGGTRELMSGWMRPLIHELPEPYRTTLRMSELEERPYREIARELGIGLSAVKSRVRRGRQQIRDALFACCTFAFDAAGRVIDYEPRRRSGRESAGSGCDCG